MWVMLTDAFFSIVHKDCKPDEVLVRARRPGDIEKVFGCDFHVSRSTEWGQDYLFRAIIPRRVVSTILIREVSRINYSNFKDSVDLVSDNDLHDAYVKVWAAMASIQNPPPFGDRRSLFTVPHVPVKPKPPVSKRKRRSNKARK